MNEEKQIKSLVISEKTVDIEQILKSRSEKLHKYLPRFILNWFKKKLHEDEINYYLFKDKEKIGVDFATAILEDFGSLVSIQGAENIRQDGRYILSANHPLGGLDGLAIISAIGQIRPDILFPVNSFLLLLPNLKPIFIPIEKIGNNTQNHSELQKAFASDATILYFPAGVCSRKQKKGIIKDLEWKKTFIAKARETKRDIIPVYVDGKNSNFFYNLARWRVRLGIKVNIEQFLLVDEMFKQKGKQVRITVGKPIPYQTFDTRFPDRKWAQIVKEHVYNLKKDPLSVFPY